MPPWPSVSVSAKRARRSPADCKPDCAPPAPYESHARRSAAPGTRNRPTPTKRGTPDGARGGGHVDSAPAGPRLRKGPAPYPVKALALERLPEHLTTLLGAHDRVAATTDAGASDMERNEPGEPTR